MVRAMLGTGQILAEEGAEAALEQGPLYLRIRDMLAVAISSGRLPKGALLLEGPVASLFASTRTPVRQAFALLESAGAIRRFDGRGFLVGQGRGAPKRLVLTAEMLGLDEEAPVLRKAPAWEAIYESLEREKVHLSVFGRHRINEVELARARGVGRQVARDALTRLETLGIVEKDERMRWTLVPLDEETILGSVGRTGRLVVVDECPLHCGYASEIAATVAERGFDLLRRPVQRVTRAHIPVPYAAELEAAVTPSPVTRPSLGPSTAPVPLSPVSWTNR